MTLYDSYVIPLKEVLDHGSYKSTITEILTFFGPGKAATRCPSSGSPASSGPDGPGILECGGGRCEAADGRVVGVSNDAAAARRPRRPGRP